MSCEYLVSYGKSGDFGRFVAEAPAAFRRGERVVIEGRRGLEIGAVLCPVTEGHRKLLRGVPVGRLLRRASADDERQADVVRRAAQELFATARALAAAAALPVEFLDAEVSFDRTSGVLQFLPLGACDLDGFAQTLGARLSLAVTLENLALAAPAAEEEHAGCGKPDCGKGAAGCTSCSSGGCSTGCGSGGVELREYFAHLRTQMETHQQRTSLL